MRSPGAIYIGTSGWHYPHWCGPFYPENLPASRMLEFYTDRFRTVDAVENALALQRMLGEDVPAGAHLAARRR